MKYVIIILLIIQLSAKAQKPTLKMDTYKEWPTVTGGNLTNDGIYAHYSINNSPVGHNTFVVINTVTKEKFTMIDVSYPSFSDDSKILYGKLPKDTMLIYNMYTKVTKKITNVFSFTLFKTGKIENILILSPEKKLTICLGNSDRKKTILNVLDYKISTNGNAIAMKTSNQSDTITLENLVWIDIPSFTTKPVLKANRIDNIIFDNEEKQVSFFTQNNDSLTIWHYDNIKSHATEIVTPQNFQNETSFLDYNIFTFSSDGKFIFFTTTEKKNIIDSIKSAPLELWSYEDKYLQSQFDSDLPIRLSKQNLYSVNLGDGTVIPLLHGNQKMLKNTFKPQTDSYIIIADTDGKLVNEYNNNAKISYWLCSTKTGLMTEFISQRKTIVSEIQISPTMRYVNYYDPEIDGYIGYNIHSKEAFNLTVSLKNELTDYDRIQEIKPETYPLGIIGYLGKDESIIVRGTYDLWSINQNPSKKSINLTNAFGTKNKIIFGLTEIAKDEIYKVGDPLAITGFNTKTKEFGFYQLIIKANPELKKLSSGNYSVSNPLTPYGIISSGEFIKAKNKPAYLVLMQSVDKSPNYYFSQDLIKFRNISQVNPERNFNWVSSELLLYSDSSGNHYSSIMYKPENFDSNKKYPIIFNYYERYSNALNIYPQVEPNSVNLNIAIAASNNYIVIYPDIKTSRRSAGEEALRTLLEAVKFLSQFPWVDTSKMGLMGHSFGGFETNYIVSHTNMFTAAISGAGNSDIISMAYDVWGIDGCSYQSYYQFSAPQMAESMAEKPDIYVKNSPILKVKSINTPVLLVHNDRDQAVPFRQSRQLFVSLRSLKKPAWLLNYKGEGHGLGKEENILDYHKKIFGFFDYFLKNKSKPQWMISHN